MTDFINWYAKKHPIGDPLKNSFRRDELRQAFEAGAASQVGTLRDEFAMASLSNYRTEMKEEWACARDVADQAYGLADAMLEARKDD
jgi:hypothetical protein